MQKRSLDMAAQAWHVYVMTGGDLKKTASMLGMSEGEVRRLVESYSREAGLDFDITSKSDIAKHIKLALGGMSSLETLGWQLVQAVTTASAENEIPPSEAINVLQKMHRMLAEKAELLRKLGETEKASPQGLTREVIFADVEGAPPDEDEV